MNIKMKKRIRQIVAGICLASAVAVAAIPADNSGIAQADTTGGINYSSDSNENRNAEFSTANNPNIPNLSASANGVVTRYSYRIMENTGDNASSVPWKISWEYKYFTEEFKGSTIGVISEYGGYVNDVDKLVLSNTINTGYQIVSSNAFETYSSTTFVSTTEYYLESPYVNHGSTNANDMKTYFPREYAEFEANYNSAKTAYENAYRENYPEASSVPEPSFADLQSYGLIAFQRTAEDMAPEYRRLYYCDHNSLKGYTLVPVANELQGLTYITNASGDTATIPNETMIYVARSVNSEVNSGDMIDSNGFKVSAIQAIHAIGEKAFYETQRVNSMVVDASIAYIGDSAFYHSHIREVEFNGVISIGNYVFKNCQYLTNVHFAEKTESIGKEAFYGCPGLTSVVFTPGLQEIGFGAFANCKNLSTVDLSACTNVNIGEYAFFDCTLLHEVIFASKPSEVSIGKAAFALSENGNSSILYDFTFPELLGTYHSATDSTFSYKDTVGTTVTTYKMGDYILAGRTNLRTVTMPANFGVNPDTVPSNIFRGCINLEKVTFNEDSRYASFDETIFKDIVNPKFCVYGPGWMVGSTTAYTLPRESTWATSTAVSTYVPYVYFDNAGKHYEVGYYPYYRYELRLDEDENTASIVACHLIPYKDENGNVQEVTSIDVLEVPGTVGEYTVTSLEDGCYSDEVKNLIKNIVVVDNSVLEIGEEVFKGCPELLTVDLGNSVQTIGENAFANNPKLTTVTIGEGIEYIDSGAFGECPVLDHVIWDRPYSYSALEYIADDAFMTGSTSGKLYFEGDMRDDYAPFVYAMDEDHYTSGYGINICYVTPAVNSGTVSRNAAGLPYVAYYVVRGEVEVTDTNGKVIGVVNENVLIDYPHYYDLPDNLRTTFIDLGYDALEREQQNMFDATKHLIVPEAVTSIDVKSFLTNSTNQKNWTYIENTPGWISGYIYDKQDIYSNDNVASTECHAGLFSGYFIEDDPLAHDKNNTGYLYFDPEGNDWIESIEIRGVRSIPAYAFDSCERLQSVIISDACEEIGKGAFINCDALNMIGTDNSTKFIFENYILYEVLSDGTYQLDICLPARRDYVNSFYDEKLTHVSSIGENAFTNCNNILEVDLSDTKIKRIPDETFKGCSKLRTIILPSTITAVGEEAFVGVDDGVFITIPRNCLLPVNAFDKNIKSVIWTYPTCDMIIGEYGEENQPNPQHSYITVRYIKDTYSITYLNEDGTLFYLVEEINEGGVGAYPPTNPGPVDEEHKGWEFSRWSFNGDYTIYDVRENRIARAIFAPPSHTITFKNDDQSIILTIDVPDGMNGYYPEEDPEPQLDIHQGLLFAGWSFDHPDKIANVHEDRTAYALYSANGNGSGGSNPNDPNNPNGGNGTNGGNGSNGGNGANGGNGSGNGNGSASGNSASGNNVSSNGVRYNVVVENGAGSGSYEPGKVVTITAYAAPTGRVFDRWTTSNSDIGFSNAYAVSTTFIMPTHDVKVTATYKQQTASGNSASGNNVNNNNNNNNGNHSGNGGSTSGNNANGNNGNRTDVTITTETIDNNHKNLASATVAGSTDNFVVKITDSAAAYAAVEQALRAQYGDLSNVRFVGFDISLYDETGTRKIENTSGLAVTITIPIPDDLVPYAGNNKAAGVVNGVLDPMTVKFTTIDGVPCMQFTATHFSPYTIYVNTNYLTMGVTDETPKTGDGIHPKWFLAAGLACLSVVLFAWKDRKKVVVK